MLGFGDELAPATDEHLVSRIYVQLGKDGKLVAEYYGCPEFVGSYGESLDYIREAMVYTI